MIEAATQTPSVAQTWLPAALSAAAALIGAWLVYRNATKANRITEQNELAGQQLAWTRQAMDEARAAKDDARTATTAARAATTAANAATGRAEAAEGRLSEVLDTAGKLMEWIARVVRKAHEVDQNDSTAADVRELLRVINGGPPEVSLSQIKRKAR
ncbi:MAG: hypothetical protein ACJ786_01125 [Catenulispora sp.]|jgi:hypothetical protein